MGLVYKRGEAEMFREIEQCVGQGTNNCRDFAKGLSLAQTP